MTSVQQALRAGELQKDTYQRLVCEDCGVPTEMLDHDGVGWQRTCPTCSRTWKQLR